MTRIIVVRHGESEGNAKNEFHGQYRSDLTEKGHKQAECTAVYLDAFPIDAIYASDIPRAFSTALHTANRRGLTVTPDEGLREIFAGEWEQMKFDDIAECYPEAYKVWRTDPAHCRCPGGESVAELCERVKAAFARIAYEEGFEVIGKHFADIAAIEKTHGDRFGLFADLLKEGRLHEDRHETAWICLNCGHIVHAGLAPNECPVCRHGQGHFVRLDMAPVIF